jgi:hypothetical protein
MRRWYVLLFIFMILSGCGQSKEMTSEKPDKETKVIETKAQVNDTAESEADSQEELEKSICVGSDGDQTLCSVLGYWYEEAKDYHIRIKLNTPTEGEIIVYTNLNNSIFSFDVDYAEEGAVSLLKADGSEISITPSEDTILVYDNDIETKFVESNQAAIKNKYDKQVADGQKDKEKLSKEEIAERFNNLEIKDGDERIPDIVVADNYPNPLSKAILETFFYKEDLTYYFKSDHGNLMSASLMMQPRDKRPERLDILTDYAGTGDSLIYTRPYKHDGDIESDKETAYVKFKMFAFPKEEVELRDKLDAHIEYLIESGLYEKMASYLQDKYATLLYPEDVWQPKYIEQLKGEDE